MADNNEQNKDKLNKGREIPRPPVREIFIPTSAAAATEITTNVQDDNTAETVKQKKPLKGILKRSSSYSFSISSISDSDDGKSIKVPEKNAVREVQRSIPFVDDQLHNEEHKAQHMREASKSLSADSGKEEKRAFASSRWDSQAMGMVSNSISSQDSLKKNENKASARTARRGRRPIKVKGEVNTKLQAEVQATTAGVAQAPTRGGGAQGTSQSASPYVALAGLAINTPTSEQIKGTNSSKKGDSKPAAENSEKQTKKSGKKM